ncbi:hypothetical protein RI367_004251 [Sorochytrium milnesiophthora]
MLRAAIPRATQYAAARQLSAAAFSAQTVSRPRWTAPAVQQLATSAACALAFQRRFYADYLVVKVPTLADSISEGTLKPWHKEVGQFVSADEEVATLETDKIDVAVNAPKSGVIVELLANPEDTVVVGQDLFKMELKDSAPEGGAEAPKQTESKPAAAPKPAEAAAAPAPPKAAATPAAPAPQTPKPQQAAAAAAPAPSKPSSQPAQPTLSTLSGPRTEKREKMNRMRMRIAERLKESQNTYAALTTFNEVDMSNIMEFRGKYKDAVLKDHGVKLGFMSAFVRAAVHAMKQVPVVNARIENDHIVYPSYVDISVAVATPKGLVTPVLRDCQNMSYLDVERAMAEMAAKARDNKIAIEDMAGGTFTISNGGVFGSMFGTPIINVPQSAILGMHAVKDRVVVVNGKMEIRPMMYICLTYDHRLIDGREATTFLVKLKEAVEDPRRMLL